MEQEWCQHFVERNGVNIFGGKGVSHMLPQGTLMVPSPSAQDLALRWLEIVSLLVAMLA